ncbi:MAG TPA: hypothetical protein VJ574_00255 [Candidatus Bathyarchaeia archaeon]|nr:hypothetical protein [Candidatus Bathyarchaeia archaeon]
MLCISYSFSTRPCAFSEAKMIVLFVIVPGGSYTAWEEPISSEVGFWNTFTHVM